MDDISERSLSLYGDDSADVYDDTRFELYMGARVTADDSASGNSGDGTYHSPEVTYDG